MKTNRISQKRQFGTTGLFVPPIIFGTSCLGNLYGELPERKKNRIRKKIGCMLLQLSGLSKVN